MSTLLWSIDLFCHNDKTESKKQGENLMSKVVHLFLTGALFLSSVSHVQALIEAQAEAQCEYSVKCTKQKPKQQGCRGA